MISTTYNMDCMAYMARLKDNAFDIAIVDPPYGINAPNMNMGSWGKYKSTASRLKRNRFDKGGGHYANSAFVTMNTEWDLNPPSRSYFEELFRVSKNQIIFGGNYFGLPPTRCFVCWEERIHPTQKPVKLYLWLMQKFCKPGDSILDTHLGSGSSRIAAYQFGFDFVGTEIDKEYYESQEKRFQAFKTDFDFDQKLFKAQEFQLGLSNQAIAD